MPQAAHTGISSLAKHKVYTENGSKVRQSVLRAQACLSG